MIFLFIFFGLLKVKFQINQLIPDHIANEYYQDDTIHIFDRFEAKFMNDWLNQIK
jgi:hypothetical protein